MFNQQPNEENMPSASVDWVIVAYKEEMSDHLKLLYEEYVFSPSDNEESACAGSTSSSEDMKMNR